MEIDDDVEKLFSVHAHIYGTSDTPFISPASHIHSPHLPTLPCGDLRTCPDHVSSLFPPTIAHRLLTGPGVTPQGKYII